MRFLPNMNLRASVGVLTKVLSRLVCWVSWEFVCRYWSLRVCGGFLLWLPMLAGILLGGRGGCYLLC